MRCWAALWRRKTVRDRVSRPAPGRPFPDAPASHGLSVILLTGFAAAIVWLIATAHGLNDYAGRPLGTDFSNVYAAGVAALKGDAAAPFDIMRQWRQEQAIFGQATPLYGWHYPPFFLLVAAPLARLPYLVALALWQLSTLALYLWALAALIRKSAMPQWAQDWHWVPLALGFTAVFVNLTHGHNGFLTAALFAGALAQLETRPLAGGHAVRPSRLQAAIRRDDSPGAGGGRLLAQLRRRRRHHPGSGAGRDIAVRRGHLAGLSGLHAFHPHGRSWNKATPAFRKSRPCFRRSGCWAGRWPSPMPRKA